MLQQTGALIMGNPCEPGSGDSKAKTVKQSMVTISQVMMPHHANPAGSIHGGVIMQMVDNAAGVVAARHTRSNVVTVSVDQIDFFNPSFIGNLVVIKASINLVGNTSMEIGARVEAENLMTGKVIHVVSAYLTFVALSTDYKSMKVCPLILETSEEKRRNMEAQERRSARLAAFQKKNRKVEKAERPHSPVNYWNKDKT